MEWQWVRPCASIDYKGEVATLANAKWFGSVEATNSFLASEDFVTNPIGVEFNPTEVWQRLKRDEPSSRCS